MATIDVQARELSGVKVEFISLVKRGANRLPFRIMKDDSTMSIDLASLFRKADNERTAEEARIQKEEVAVNAARELLAKSGFAVFSPEQLKKAGIGVPTTQDGTNADDGTPNPAAPDGGKNPAQGSTPAVGGNDDDGDPSPEEPDNGTNPVGKLWQPAQSIPASGDGTDVPMTQPGGAKKADAPMPPPAAAGADPDDDAGNADDGSGAADVPMTKTAKAKKGENPAQSSAAQNAEDEANEEAVAAAPKGKAMKGDADIHAMFVALQKQVGDFATQMTGFAGQLQKLDGSVAAVNDRVAKSEAAVQKSDARLSALIPGQAPNDHAGSVRKTDKVLPLLDTAFMKP